MNGRQLSAQMAFHSGKLQTRSLGFSNFFRVLDLVAKSGRFFVIFAIDGALEPLPELQQLGFSLFGLGIAAGGLAAVPGFTVNILEEGHQLSLENLIVARATEAMIVGKIEELAAANR